MKYNKHIILIFSLNIYNIYLMAKDYLEKYLKYKNKYVKRKYLQYGSNGSFIITKNNNKYNVTNSKD